MKIDYDSLRQFVNGHDDVQMYAPQGIAVILKSGNTDIHKMIETADTFVFQGKKYTRAEFEKLLDSK